MDIFEITDLGTPIVATALHAGHAIRPEVLPLCALDEETRLREEDPYTGMLIDLGTTRVCVNASRFELDLNRLRDAAVYKRPDDAWGLAVWRAELPPDVVARSLCAYDRFYRAMRRTIESALASHKRVLVLDVHSYNYRRGGPSAPVADVAANPEVNLGTRTMDRGKWSPVVDAFLGSMRASGFDVRENVKFGGGYFPRWVHETFPGAACALAIEFKKTFMDEWTCAPDQAALERIHTALLAALHPLEVALTEVAP